MRSTTLSLLVLALVVTRGVANGDVVNDIRFAAVDGVELRLDLYRPVERAKGVIVWVHGGAWRSGSRKNVGIAGLTARGWAVASADYRLTPVARFPAQVHDLKAAIRFLRARADELGLPASPIVIAGTSAGGHLAALVGVTNDVEALEGAVGAGREASSSVQAILVHFGASNLTTILAQSTPHGLGVRVPALELLLGGQPTEAADLARLASPVLHVTPDDPPLLWLHGDQDPQMPINQAHEMIGAYEALGLTADLKVMHGAAHGGPEFTDDAALDLMDDFLRRNLASEP